MRGMTRFLLVLAVGAMVFSSCATKHDFTEKYRTDYGLKDEILPRIQFFNSSEIILFRADSESGLAIENGEVVVTNANSEDQIVIPKGTKGKYVNTPSTGKLAIRFELGEGKYLVFKSAGSYKGRYMLAAEKWEQKNGVITYGGDKYYVTGSSGAAYLQFKLKNLNSYKKKSRVVGGVDVD